jgi:hypothetical protein
LAELLAEVVEGDDFAVFAMADDFPEEREGTSDMTGHEAIMCSNVNTQV